MYAMEWMDSNEPRCIICVESLATLMMPCFIGFHFYAIVLYGHKLINKIVFYKQLIKNQYIENDFVN
jgi:hypothetical protein